MKLTITDADPSIEQYVRALVKVLDYNGIELTAEQVAELPEEMQTLFE